MRYKFKIIILRSSQKLSQRAQELKANSKQVGVTDLITVVFRVICYKFNFLILMLFLAQILSSAAFFWSISPSGGLSRSQKATNLIIPSVVKNSASSGFCICFLRRVKIARFNKSSNVLLQNLRTGILESYSSSS